MISNWLKNLVPSSVKARIKVGDYSKKIKERMLNLEKEEGTVSLLIGTPMHTNLGDHLITMSQLQYLREIGYSQKVIEIPTEMYQMFHAKICRLINVDTVFINGGGWMGNLWIPEELLMQQIIKEFSDKKIVIFPQTIYFDEKIKPYDTLIMSANKIFSSSKNVTLCVREKKSYDFAVNNYVNIKIVQIPDIALSYYQWAPKNELQRNKKIGLCLRNDREVYGTGEKKQYVIKWFEENKYTLECIDTMYKYRVNIDEREQIVWQRLADFASYDFIITDRLHGMIFSYICGTPCIVFDNITHKVSGVYKTWLSNSKKIFPIFEEMNIDNLKSFVMSDLNFEENVCPLNQFDDLKEIIRYGKN